MTNLRKFITTCTLTFKAFDFDVTMSEGKSSLWNFTTSNSSNDKKYAVFCTSKVSKVRGLIKVAIKKLPKDHRLVVITESHTPEELEQANEQNFCLVSLETLNKYGQEMLDIREKESINGAAGDLTDKEIREELENTPDPSDFIDKVINKDKLF